MKKHFKSISSLLILVALLILPYFVFAESTSTTLGTLSTVATQGGYQGQGNGDQKLLSSALGTVIAGALSLLGAIFIILVIIGGYLWMTAGGNEEKVSKAQSYIKQAAIGLIITLSTWAIWDFLIKKLVLK